MRNKLQWSKALFVMLLFAFSVLTSQAQTAASATWALTSNGNASTSGSVTATAVAIGSGINTPTYNSTVGISTGSWQDDAGSLVNSEYYEYKITPTTGSTLFISSVTGEHSRTNGNWLVAAYYSLDNFATRTQIGSNISINSSSSTAFSFDGLEYEVTSGTTFSVRIYAWESDGNNRSYRNKNIVISGVTCPNMSITTQPTPQSLCAGNTLTLTSAFSNASTFQWYRNGVAISGATSASYSKSNASTVDGGNYYVIASNGCGKTLQSNSVVVTVNPSPNPVTASASENSICSGNSTSLSASSYDPPSATNSVSPSTSIPDNDQTNGVTSQITLPATCASANEVSAVTLNVSHTYAADLDVYLISPNGTQLALITDKGGSSNNIIATLQTGGNVLPTSNTSISGTYAPQSPFSNFSGPAAGVWTLRVYDDALQDIGTLNSWSITVSSDTCGIVSYSWSPATGLSSSTVQNPTATPNITTNYTVTVTASNGCSNTSSPVAITVTTPPSAGTLSGTQSICSNGTTTFTSTVSGGAWTSGNTAVATINSASGVVTPVAVGTATMTYTVTGTGGCANATATRTVTVTAPPTAGTLSGTQSVCSNGTTSFTSTVSGGAWTSGNTAVATINSASGVVTPVAAGTATMTYTVTGTGGCANATATRSVTISSLSVGGSVSGTATICSGTGADLTLSGHVGNVVRWESAVSPFTTWTPIANTATAYNSGALTQETKFRAVVQNGACAEAYSSEATLSFASTTWNGTSWVGGAPAANKTLTIAANYTSPGSNFNLQGCSLTVQNNAVVTIVPQDSVVLSGALTVTTGSTMTFEPQAHLIQSGTTNLNSGAVIVKANSAPIKRLDYTLWSAPVAGQQLQAFSPLTLANRFYNYDSDTNFYTVVPSPSTTSFEAAKGVLIRVANTHSATQPQSWAGTFTGVPNSGTYSIPLANFGPGKRFTLVGNPYPSPIDPEAFINNPNNAAAITGTLYLWRKTNGSNKPSYCTFNLGGFITNGEDHSNNVANLPYQVIQTGQGFFVEGTGSGSGNVVFDNTMRIDDHTNSFLRTANTAHTTNSVERNRVWLNVTNTAGAFSQAMIGYVTNATNGFDMNYDGKYINDGEIALASILNAEPYAIQCKALPFSTSDVIPMQFTATTAGTYSIAVDRVDGLFASGQAVYLRDTVTGTVHNLSEGAYSFAAESGTFNARFEVVFQASTLGVTDPVLNENQVVIYKTPANEISINTGNFVMDNVMIYDLAGRLLFQQKDINNSQALIKVGFATEVLLVKIKTQDGKSVTKKVLFPRTTLKKDLKISTIQVAEDE